MLIWSLEQWGNCCATGLSKAITVKAKLETRIPECGLDYSTTAAAAKSLQPCLTLCDPIDGSPPGSPVPGILQARMLEWVTISFFNAWKWKVKNESEVTQSCLTLSYPTDCSLPGSPVHGIFQARVLEWSAIAFSNLVLTFIKLTFYCYLEFF